MSELLGRWAGYGSTSSSAETELVSRLGHRPDRRGRPSVTLIECAAAISGNRSRTRCARAFAHRLGPPVKLH
jgi:hypothetical protein